MTKRKVINILIILSSITSTLMVIFARDIDYKYSNLWVLPMTFTITFSIIIIPILCSNKFKITTYFYTILAWIRLVLIPALNGLTGIYENNFSLNISKSSVNTAILLVSWELIVTSIALLIIVKYKKQFSCKTVLKLKGHTKIYGLFILLAIGLYVFIGRNLNILNFLIIPVHAGDRFGDITDTYQVLIRQIIKVAFVVFFIWITSVFNKKYQKRKKKIYVLIPVLIGLINIAVIVGERRSEQVYTGLVVLFILAYTFKDYRNKIIISVITMTAFVLLFMSVYKHFAAFLYGSYSDALAGSNFNLQWLTKTLQSYFFGTDNVALAVEFSKSSNLSIGNLIYDYARSIFGISFLLKDRMIMTIEYFNTFIYGFSKSSGHLLSGVGYGYIYFGWILSPIIVIVNLLISTTIEKLFTKTNSIELKYIYGYMLVRFATDIFVNTPPLISLSTIMYFTAGSIYFIAKLFKPVNRIDYLNINLEISK